MKEGFNLTILSGQGWVSSNKHPQNTKCLNIPGTISPNPLTRDEKGILGLKTKL